MKTESKRKSDYPLISELGQLYIPLLYHMRTDILVLHYRILNCLVGSESKLLLSSSSHKLLIALIQLTVLTLF